MFKESERRQTSMEEMYVLFSWRGCFYEVHWLVFLSSVFHWSTGYQSEGHRLELEGRKKGSGGPQIKAHLLPSAHRSFSSFRIHFLSVASALKAVTVLCQISEYYTIPLDFAVSVPCVFRKLSFKTFEISLRFNEYIKCFSFSPFKIKG